MSVDGCLSLDQPSAGPASRPRYTQPPANDAGIGSCCCIRYLLHVNLERQLLVKDNSQVSDSGAGGQGGIHLCRISCGLSTLGYVQSFVHRIYKHTVSVCILI